MRLFQIAVCLLLASFSVAHGSGVLEPHIAAAAVPVAPVLRYSLVAPQNIRPFAAQVSTFTRGLNIFAAPYAAGVLSAPAIVPRAVVPGIPPVPAVPYVSAPLAHAVAPGHPHLHSAPAYSPVSLYPAVYPGPVSAPFAHASVAAAPVAVPAPVYPAPAPATLLPGPFARSVHAVSPAAVLPHAGVLR